MFKWSKAWINPSMLQDDVCQLSMMNFTPFGNTAQTSEPVNQLYVCRLLWGEMKLKMKLLLLNKPELSFISENQVMTPSHRRANISTDIHMDIWVIQSPAYCFAFLLSSLNDNTVFYFQPSHLRSLISNQLANQLKQFAELHRCRTSYPILYCHLNFLFEQ